MREIKFRAYHKERKKRNIWNRKHRFRRKESSFNEWDNKTFKRGFQTIWTVTIHRT